MGPLIPLFWTSGDVSSGFQSQSGQPYLCLVINMAAEPSLPHTYEALVELEVSCCCSQCEIRQTLYRLSYHDRVGRFILPY